MRRSILRVMRRGGYAAGGDGEFGGVRGGGSI